MATLRVLGTTDANLQGKSFALDRDLRIGRDPAGNDLVINEPRVSRRHARIALSADGTVVIDEGSDNGVWIAGTRVTRHRLSDGDRIGIGETTFLFEDPLAGRQTVVAPMPPAPPQPQTAPPQSTAPPAAPAKRAGGCAIGCLVLSILLFFGTIGGSLFALYHYGYLPGIHAGASAP